VAERDVLAELAVPIDPQFQRFERAMRDMGSKFDAFGRRIENRSTQLESRVGGIFTGLGGKIVGALGVLGGYRAAQGIATLEDEFAELRKVTGDTFPQMREELKRLASETRGVSAESIVQLATAGRKLGVADEELIVFTKDMAKLKVALSDIDASQLATDTARILNVFGTSMLDAGRFGSALNWLSDNSAATAGEILDLTRRLSGAASTLRMTETQTMTLATAMLEAGINVEVGGTAIIQTFGKMATDATEFAKIAGVSSRTFSKALRQDPIRALKLLEIGLNRLDEQSRFAALDSLGLDGTRVAMTILQLGKTIDRIPEKLQNANSQWTTMASLNKEAKVRGETFRGAMDQLWNRLKAIGDTIGQILKPAFEAFFGVLTRGFGSVQSWLERNRQALTDVVNTVVWASGQVWNFVTGNIVQAWEYGSTVVRNWGLIVEEATMRAIGWGQNVVEAARWAGRAFGTFLVWFGKNWRTVLVDVANLGYTVVSNLAANFYEFGKRLWDYIASGFDSSKLVFDFTPLLEGFRATVEQMPEIAAPVWADMEDRIAEIRERMQAAENKRLGIDLGPIKPEDLAKPPEPGKVGDGPNAEGGGAPFDKTERNRPEFLGALDLVKRIQEGAFGAKDRDAEIASATSQTAVATGRMAIMLQQLLEREATGMRIAE
jgi:TP901 family phage tail tape measure protein